MSSVRRRFQTCAAVILAAVVSSCVTKREELSEVRSNFGFDSGLWGGQGGSANGDQKKIKETFADTGWKKDEEGNITNQALNEDLYREKGFRGDKDYNRKEARLKNRDVARDVYRTPEYLERQGYKGKKSATDSKLAYRESDFDQNRAGESGRDARGSDDSPGFLRGLNPFRSKTARESAGSFKTVNDREGTSAQANAAIPEPGPAMTPRGNYREAALTMDDVKKLLRPEEFD